MHYSTTLETWRYSHRVGPERGTRTHGGCLFGVMIGDQYKKLIRQSGTDIKRSDIASARRKKQRHG